MFDLGASGESRGANRILVSVHQGAQPLFFRFVAGGIQLLGGKHHRGLAKAIVGEDFDQVGAGVLLLAHEGADFIRRPGLLASSHERLDGGQDARAGEHAPGDGIAQSNIGGRAYALHGGETRHQSHPCIRGCGIGGLLGVRTGACQFSILAEEPAQCTCASIQPGKTVRPRRS